MSHAMNRSQRLQMLKYVNNQQMHFSIHDVFYSQNSHQHVSAGIPAIRGVIFLYNNTKIIKLITMECW
jgi:Fe2+ or Zn2+ uptake regulation protein